MITHLIYSILSAFGDFNSVIGISILGLFRDGGLVLGIFAE